MRRHRPYMVISHYHCRFTTGTGSEMTSHPHILDVLIVDCTCNRILNVCALNGLVFRSMCSGVRAATRPPIYTAHAPLSQLLWTAVAFMSVVDMQMSTSCLIIRTCSISGLELVHNSLSMHVCYIFVRSVVFRCAVGVRAGYA